MANAESPALSSYGEVPESSGHPVFVIVCVVLLLLILGGIAGTIYLQRQGKAKATSQQAQSQTPASTAASAPTSASDNSSSGAPAEAASSTPTPVSSAPIQPASAPPQPVSAPAVAESLRAMNLGNYPGATPVAIATLSGETVVAGFLTRDTPQQVMQYYKIRFPVSTMAESEGKADLSATLPGGVRIRIHAEPQGGNTQVMVLQEN